MHCFISRFINICQFFVQFTDFLARFIKYYSEEFQLLISHPKPQQVSFNAASFEIVLSRISSVRISYYRQFYRSYLFVTGTLINRSLFVAQKLCKGGFIMVPFEFLLYFWKASLLIFKCSAKKYRKITWNL